MIKKIITFKNTNFLLTVSLFWDGVREWKKNAIFSVETQISQFSHFILPVIPLKQAILKILGIANFMKENIVKHCHVAMPTLLLCAVKSFSTSNECVNISQSRWLTSIKSILIANIQFAVFLDFFLPRISSSRYFQDFNELSWYARSSQLRF